MDGLRSTATLAVLVIAWYTLSAFAVVALKRTFSKCDDGRMELGAVLDATLGQLICGALIGHFYVTSIERNKAAMAVPIGRSGGGFVALDGRGFVALDGFSKAAASNILLLASTNWAVLVGGASGSQIFKLVEPAITIPISYFLLGERTSLARIAAISLTVLGTYLCSSQIHFDVGGEEQFTPVVVSPFKMALLFAVMVTASPLRNGE